MNQLSKIVLAAVLLAAAAIPLAAQSVAGVFPDAILTTRDGTGVSLKSLHGQRATVVVFSSAACPVSKAYMGRMRALHVKFRPQGVNFVVVSPNVGEKLAAGEDLCCIDPDYTDKSLARQVSVSVTPHAFVLDGKGVLRYSGAIDDNRNPDLVREHLLLNAIEAVLAGQTPRVRESKAFGTPVRLP
ncbi:MAG: redoxin domain-containing protein [Acidobacteria bacterium]|nr:redoxin domain-containing protein [Acidobacteriota bacterium]